MDSDENLLIQIDLSSSLTREIEEDKFIFYLVPFLVYKHASKSINIYWSYLITVILGGSLI